MGIESAVAFASILVTKVRAAVGVRPFRLRSPAVHNAPQMKPSRFENFTSSRGTIGAQVATCPADPY